MYAIINISGKQYKAISGSRLRVPKQNGNLGKTLTFDQVLLTNDGKNTEIGNPTIKGFSVTATIVNHGRDKKILVYKKKRRKGYQRKNGHRQWYTEIEFNSIEAAKKQSVKEKTILSKVTSQEEE